MRESTSRRGRVALVVAAFVVAAIGALLPEDLELLARAAAAGLTAALAVRAARTRGGEHPGPWNALAASHVLLLLVWGPLSRFESLTAFPGILDGLRVVAALGVAAALYLAMDTRRDRVVMLDGGVLAAAILAIVWTTFLGPAAMASNGRAQAAAVAYVVAAILPVSLLPAGLARSGRHPTRLMISLALSLALNAVATIGFAWRSLLGDQQLVVGRMAWIAGPLVLSVVAVSRDRLTVERDGVTQTHLTRARFLGLVGLALVPVVVAAAARSAGLTEARLVFGAGASIVALLVLLARIWATTDFAIEDERAASLARLGALVHHSADVVCVVRADSRITYVTPSVQRVLGLRPVELEGRSILRVLGPDDQDVVPTMVAAAGAASLHPPEFRARLQHVDGHLVDVDGTVVDLREDPHIGGFLVTFRDVTDRVALEESLTAAALRDDLTGLPNRAMLRDRVEHALARRHRDHTGVALLFIDLDRFKRVNDVLGHRAGDDLLRAVAERMRGVLRDSDTPARLAGDEFAVLVEQVEPGREREVAERVARRVRAALARPFDLQGRPVRVGCSIGVAIAGGTVTPDELVEDADAAMYTAKRSMVDDVVTFDAELERGVRQHGLAERLEQAINDDELEVVYHPVIDFDATQVPCVEALLRWRGSDGGDLPPRDIVALAERAGLINRLTTWTLDRIAEDLRMWQQRSGRTLHVAINVSAPQLLGGDLLSELGEAFVPRGLRVEQVTLEFREDALLEHADHAVKVLEVARAAGCRVAIDEFGVDSVSLAALRDLPIDAVKMDRTLVAELEDGANGPSFARLLHQAARGLGIRSFCAGIETAHQLEVVRELGFDGAQGWLFCLPGPLDELPAEYLRPDVIVLDDPAAGATPDAAASVAHGDGSTHG